MNVDLTQAAEVVKLFKGHWDSVNQVPDEAWLYKTPIDVYVHDDEYTYTLPKGKYKIYVKNTNPLPFSHPEFVLDTPGSDVSDHGNKIVLRNSTAAREYQRVFVLDRSTDIRLRISCHTTFSLVLRAGRAHVFLGILKME